MVEIICTDVENRKMRTIQIISEMGGRIKWRMMEGVNSNMIHYKKFGKCHNVPPV
jgi:hypothetical protein